MLLTVPGNLLLLGEYAVTEEGGLGLALAVDRRVSLELEPSSALVVEGRWGGGTAHWTRESAGRSPLITAIVETWREQVYSRGVGAPGAGATRMPDSREPGARIVVDSSAFFTAGRKSGFGSSAAVTVALTCALLHLSGFSGSQLIRCAARIALLAHRRAQGGRGSGYDVYASLYGGFGCLAALAPASPHLSRTLQRFNAQLHPELRALEELRSRGLAELPGRIESGRPPLPAGGQLARGPAGFHCFERAGASP
jgi:phosphomevalonate kinase